MPKFSPKEVIFSPTGRCNLSCPHCTVERTDKILSKESAVKFLIECKKIGIEKVGFTGGEPFLATDFLCTLANKAFRLGIFFNRVMTNGVWFRNKKQLIAELRRFHRSGYDGSICISVDVFHRQDLKKIALFINSAVSIWGRKDIVSIAYISDAQYKKTAAKLKRLAKLMGAHLVSHGKKFSHIKNENIFIKLFNIKLSPVGKARKFKNPWDGKWFKEDYCEGPGNIFFVLPDGSVKPCCGYATNSDMLTIGNIKKDNPRDIMDNVKNNRFVSAIFGSGLSMMRKRLEQAGVKFPGKTTNHCYFCNHIIMKGGVMQW